MIWLGENGLVGDGQEAGTAVGSDPEYIARAWTVLGKSASEQAHGILEENPKQRAVILRAFNIA